MIRPQLSPDGRAVDIPLDRITGPLLDALAVAYAEDADVVGQLLAEHAYWIACRDRAAADPCVTDYGRASASAAADASREALSAELDAEALRTPRLTPAAARQLGDRLHRLATAAAHTRWRTTAQENAA
jgi:hypothetical protein